MTDSYETKLYDMQLDQLQNVIAPASRKELISEYSLSHSRIITCKIDKIRKIFL